MASEATDSRLKADFSISAHELDARALLMEEAMKAIGIDKTLSSPTA